MYRTGEVISSNTTSAGPSPLGLGPATSSATAGLAASAELAAGKPVSGAIDRAALAPDDGRAPGLAGGAAAPTGLGTRAHPTTTRPATTASPAAAGLARGDARAPGMRQRLGTLSAGLPRPLRVRAGRSGGPLP